MISKALLAVLVIIFAAFLIVIGKIVEYFGIFGLFIIFAIIIFPIIIEYRKAKVDINDAIIIGSKIVTETSESVTNAAKSVSGAVNAGASLLSAVKRVKDHF